MASPGVVSPLEKRFYQHLHFREALDGWIFALPAALGLLIFTVGPVLASLGLSFTDYNIVKAPSLVGIDNYRTMFTDDSLYWKSLGVTTYYSLAAVPLGLIFSFCVALLMNQKIRGIVVYRVIWYLPALVPAVANGALWRWILNSDFGLINAGITSLGLPGPGWLIEPTLTVPVLILIQLWGVGNSVLIYLAGLQGVPEHLYEAAEIDGASWWDKFWNVTMPMMSSIIFFNLIMGIIGSFQVFGVVYVLYGVSGSTSTAGPENAAMVYVIYLYRNAFQYFKMGYASAMAWVLFAIIGALTALVFRFQSRWVYYEADKAR